MNSRPYRAALFALLCQMGLAHSSWAAIKPLGSAFQIDHANPEASIPSIAARNAKPLEFGYFLQDLATFAEAAKKSGDHLTEARYYGAFTKAVPDSAVGFSKLCEALDSARQREGAVTACRQALGLSGASLKDYVRFVHLTLEKKEPLSPNELEDVTQAVAHLRAAPETRVAGSHLQCEVGVRTESIPLLEECTAALAAAAPRDPKTIAFQWALAVRKGDQDGARTLIGLAKNTGMTADGIARMERATVLLDQGWRRWLLDWRVLLTALALITLALSIVYARHRREMMKSRLPIGSSATS